MDHKKLEEYFEKYIIKYHPYSEHDTYRTIFEYIRDYYLNDSYCKIPVLSKLMVEKSVISYHLYDKYLESFGFPKEIIQSLTASEKEILILSATDYMKYKSTIYMVKNIASTLSNELSVYELYIIMKNNKLYFTPVPIYLSDSIRKNPTSALTGKLYKYIDIYLKADYYFVTENEIERLYRDNLIFFPLKSNLILLDFFISYDDTSLFKRLLESIVINTFRDTIIDMKVVLMDSISYEYVCSKDITESSSDSLILDSSYTTFRLTLYEVIVLYYYLYLSYYNAVFPVLPLVDVPVITSDLSSIRYTISDLEDLIVKYENIKDRDDAVEYYYTFIKNVFSVFISNYEEVTVNELKERIYTGLKNLINVIERIEKYCSEYILVNRAMVYSSVLENISNSVKAFAYSLNNKLIKKILIGFVDSLPKISPNDKKTSNIHKIIMELKPYHTQIISKYRLVEISNDYFNLIRPDDRSIYTVKSELDTVEYLSDSDRKHLSYRDAHTSYPIVTSNDEIISMRSDDEVSIKPDDRNAYTVKSELNTVEYLSDSDRKHLSYRGAHTSYSIVTNNDEIISMRSDDEVSKTHEIFNTVRMEYVTRQVISDYFVILDQ